MTTATMPVLTSAGTWAKWHIPLRLTSYTYYGDASAMASRHCRYVLETLARQSLRVSVPSIGRQPAEAVSNSRDAGCMVRPRPLPEFRGKTGSTSLLESGARNATKRQRIPGGVSR